MSDLNANLLRCSALIDKYLLIGTIVFIMVFGIIIYFRKKNYLSAPVIGHVFLVALSFVSFGLFLNQTLLLGEKSLRKVESASIEIPNCLTKLDEQCKTESEEFISLVNSNFVPYSDLLGLSVACLCFATLIALLYTIREAWLKA